MGAPSNDDSTRKVSWDEVRQQAGSPLRRMIHLATKCTSEDDFVQRYAPFVTEDSVAIPTASALKVGDNTRFLITLKDRTPIMRGKCEVVEVRPTRSGARPGSGNIVQVKLLQMDAASRAVYARLLNVKSMPAIHVLEKTRDRFDPEATTVPTGEEAGPPRRPVTTPTVQRLNTPLAHAAAGTMRQGSRGAPARLAPGEEDGFSGDTPTVGGRDAFDDSQPTQKASSLGADVLSNTPPPEMTPPVVSLNAPLPPPRSGPVTGVPSPAYPHGEIVAANPLSEERTDVLRSFIDSTLYEEANEAVPSSVKDARSASQDLLDAAGATPAPMIMVPPPASVGSGRPGAARNPAFAATMMGAPLPLPSAARSMPPLPTAALPRPVPPVPTAPPQDAPEPAAQPAAPDWSAEDAVGADPIPMAVEETSEITHGAADDFDLAMVSDGPLSRLRRGLAGVAGTIEAKLTFVPAPARRGVARVGVPAALVLVLGVGLALAFSGPEPATSSTVAAGKKAAPAPAKPRDQAAIPEVSPAPEAGEDEPAAETPPVVAAAPTPAAVVQKPVPAAPVQQPEEPEAPTAEEAPEETTLALAGSRNCVVRVNTAPRAARVYWGNRKLGQTPLRDVEVPCGATTVMLKRPRFSTIRREVVARPGERVILTERLRRPAARLRIQTTPDGARVVVNGRPVGNAAKGTQVFRFESARIEVTAPGFKPYVVRKYMRGRNNRVSAKLTPAGGKRP